MSEVSLTRKVEDWKGGAELQGGKKKGKQNSSEEASLGTGEGLQRV